AIAYDTALGLADYVQQAGGYTQNADATRIVIAHRDGSFDEYTNRKKLFAREKPVDVVAGDEILVLPKIDVKSRQIWKDMTQILYQIAVSARVVVRM
ncbi:MAG: hypothetical protein KDI23_06240, partial [Pseudomonadales bacterium]|nr:hypothetical protein [Pseudomonadales bacterium]